MEQWLFHVAAVAVPAIFAITIHEAAHGWVAWHCGDDTAWRMGRVTFNPLRHIDPIGTLLLPAVVYFSTGYAFGWAKPVPVNFNRLRRPRRDMVLVAAAGPAANLLLALISSWLLGRLPLSPQSAVDSWIGMALGVSVLVNVVLMVFNMIPLPPLDGGRMAVGLLPDRPARLLAGLERAGIALILSVLFIIPFIAEQLGYHFNALGWLLGPPVTWAVDVITRLTGAT